MRTLVDQSKNCYAPPQWLSADTAYEVERLLGGSPLAALSPATALFAVQQP